MNKIHILILLKSLTEKIMFEVKYVFYCELGKKNIRTDKLTFSEKWINNEIQHFFYLPRSFPPPPVSEHHYR